MKFNFWMDSLIRLAELKVHIPHYTICLTNESVKRFVYLTIIVAILGLYVKKPVFCVCVGGGCSWWGWGGGNLTR